jgi:subtilase family serine protease
MERVGHRRSCRSCRASWPFAARSFAARSFAARFIALSLLVMSASAVAAVPVSLASPAGANTPAAVRLGHPPRLPAGAQPGSSLPSSVPLDVDVVLAPRNPAALSAFARAVTTVGSPAQGKFLGRGQFATRFGATAATVAAVTATLRQGGLHPGPVSANGLSIPVRATEGTIARAFATGFRQYRLRNGRTIFANTAAPLVAASAAPDVQAVVGLDDLAVPVPALSPAPGLPAAGPPGTGRPRSAALGTRAGRTPER